MKPGQITPAQGPELRVASPNVAKAVVHNRGRLAASIGSHTPLDQLSASLQVDGLRPGRLLLPAGATIRIGPGEHKEVAITWT